MSPINSETSGHHGQETEAHAVTKTTFDFSIGSNNNVSFPYQQHLERYDILKMSPLIYPAEVLWKHVEMLVSQFPTNRFKT